MPDKRSLTSDQEPPMPRDYHPGDDGASIVRAIDGRTSGETRDEYGNHRAL